MIARSYLPAILESIEENVLKVSKLQNHRWTLFCYFVVTSLNPDEFKLQAGKTDSFREFSYFGIICAINNDKPIAYGSFPPPASS